MSAPTPDDGLTVVNFAHPLTPTQRARIGELAGRPPGRVIDVPTQLDNAQPFAPQVAALVAAAGLTAAEWQTLPLVINPPSYAPVAAALLAHLHGRCGYFPTIVRLRPIPGSAPPAFEVAELLPLQEIREDARRLRGG